MERQRFQERTEAELRSRDVALFWMGFQRFRYENPDMEKDVAGKIKSQAAEMGISGGFEGAIEASMIFLYSVNLAKKMQPAIAGKVADPGFRVTDKENVSFCRAPLGENIYGPGQFEAGLTSLLIPEKAWSYHVTPWHDDDAQTVSRFLPDWIIVDIAIGGPEEYAHELFCNLKPKKTVKKAFRQYNEIFRQQRIISGNGHPELASIHYHTGDIERHGLIWTHRFVEQYFPHWSYATRDLADKVSKIRYLRTTSKKPNFWQKMLGKVAK